MRKRFGKLKKKAEVFFRNAGPLPPSLQQSPQNNAFSADQLSPSLLSSNDNSGEQPQLPSIPYPSVTAIDLPPSSTLSDGNRAGQSPPSITAPHDNTVSAERLRPSSQMSMHGSINSAERLRPHDGILRHSNSDSMQQLQVPRIPESVASQMPNVLTQNSPSYDVQSLGGNATQIQLVSTHNANIYEFHGNQNIHNYGNAGPIEHLAMRSMLGATFDSSDRDPPPRCHPHTRHDILQSIQKKIHDPDEKAKITWMKGGAGVGKSAIMQTVAEVEAESNTLGASLFFSRPNNRNDPQKVFTTIALQLAMKLPSYQQYLIQRIATDPLFLNKTMEKLFQDLIVVPFAKQQLLTGQGDRVILIDGLDECEGSWEQNRIIELIHDFVSNNRTVPLLWIIASRPEEHLLDAFSEIKACSRALFWEKEVPIDSEQSVRDVEHYLHDEFTKISKRYRRLMPAEVKWPSEKQFLVLSRAASGLFIFASTVIRFIDNDENPVYRLEIVVPVIEKHLKGPDLRMNPLETLDKLYERILSEISSDTLSTAKLVLGYLIIRPHVGEPALNVHPPSKLFWTCNILGLEQHAIYGALRKLRSVLAFPEPEDAYEGEVRFLHASFSDYLRDMKRSGTYSVNLDDIATRLWNRFMMILQQWEKRYSYDDVEHSWSIESMTKVMRGQDTKIMEWKLVDYAGFYWQYLLRQHFESPDTAFRLSLSLEDLMKQLKQRDYSYQWTVSHNPDDTYNVIKCLEEHVPIDLYKDIIQDVSFASLEKIRFLRSLYERRWSSYITANRDFRNLNGKAKQDFGNDLNKLEQFLREESKQTCVILDSMKDADSAPKLVGKVLGMQPSKCRVVLRDVESGSIPYCFPYIV